MPILKPNLAAVAAKIIDGEAIIMNLRNGAYYSMTEVGAAVWEMIEPGAPLEALQDGIVHRYLVERSVAFQDVERVVNELLAEELIVTTEGTPLERPPTDAAAPRGTYHPPVLNKYTEMADLLALDPPMPSLPLEPGRSG